MTYGSHLYFSVRHFTRLVIAEGKAQAPGEVFEADLEELLALFEAPEDHFRPPLGKP